MNAPSLPRPPKVTLACLFVGLTCGFLVLSIMSTLSDWGSVELQEALADALDGPVELELSVGTLMTWLRWLLTAVAAAAAGGIVLAVYTARGHQGARIALTVLAGLLALFFASSGLLGLLPAAFAFGCAFYLWSPESRAWFDAKNGRVPAATEPARPDPFAAPAAGAAPVDAAHGPASPATYPGPGPTTARPVVAARRPAPVLVAGVVTLVASGLVAAVAGLNALLYLSSPGEYERLLADQPVADQAVEQLGVSVETLARGMFVGCTLLALLALVGVLAGALVLAGLRAGRVLALVASGLTVPLALVLFPVGLPWAVSAALVLWWLTRPEARAWFAAR